MKNTDSGRTYSQLKPAVRAAKPRDHLVVSGTCHGSTVIDKDLVVEGKQMRGGGTAILDGDRKARVVRIKPDIKVIIRDLTIQEGKAGRLYGAGIINRGNLELRDVVVRRNRAGGGGGGIYNEGKLRLWGSSRIKNNYADGYAGGLFNAGTATMNDTSSILANAMGGVLNTGTLTLRDASSIRDNEGLGVSNGDWDNDPGVLILNGSSVISGNEAGVMNGPGSALTMNASSAIRGHYTTSGTGAGVYNYGTLTMTGASAIHDNHTTWASGAGGLYHSRYYGGALVGVNCAPHTYANIYGNSPIDCVISAY